MRCIQFFIIYCIFQSDSADNKMVKEDTVPAIPRKEEVSKTKSSTWETNRIVKVNQTEANKGVANDSNTHNNEKNVDQKNSQKADSNRQEVEGRNLNLNKVETSPAKQFLIVNRTVSMSPTTNISTPNFSIPSYAHSSTEKDNITTQATSHQNIVNQESNISDQIYKDKGSVKKRLPKPKTELDKEIETLEKRYSDKIDRINEGFIKPERKIDLDKVDVNSNRPSILGPSRFETGFSKTIQEIQPSRNESVYSKREYTTKATTNSLDENKLSKSKTTVDILSPESRRKRFDSNFNAVPEPFKTTSETFKSTNRFESKYQGKSDEIPLVKPTYQARHLSRFESPTSSSYSSYTSTYSVSSLPTPSSVTSTIPSSSVTSVSSSYSSSTTSRAKSEGNNLLSASSQYKDFYSQIQSTKDKYKSDFEKAMNFDRTSSKPPVIKEKFPRPDQTPTLSRDYSFRRQERESTVMKALINDRSKRGKSDEISKSTSFRF